MKLQLLRIESLFIVEHNRNILIIAQLPKSIKV